MQELKITAPGPDGHYHIVYINSATGVGQMSPALDGHSHNLVFDPPREPVEPTEAIPPQVDPMTGMPMIDPMTGQPDMGQPANPGDPGKDIGTFMVAPSEDGHNHEIIEYRTSPKKKESKPDSDVINSRLALWREARSLVSDSIKKGRESEKYYKGEQWDSSVLAELDRLNRAGLTINEIAPNIDTLIGYQMEQRTDLRYLPQESGDQRVADMLNVVSKKILDSCYYPREETKVFKDICVAGFGVLNMYMNFEENIQGVIKVERFPWDDTYYGPHEKEDLSDCEYEIKSRMQSLAKLKQSYPKKAKEIEQSFNSYRGQYPDLNKMDDGRSGTHMDYRDAPKIEDGFIQTLDGDIRLLDLKRKQFRLVQVTEKNYEEVTVLFNVDEEFFLTAYDWKEKDVELAATIPGFQVISQLKTRMRITKFCGNVVLSDENPAQLPIHDFFTIPVYAYRQNGEFWGKVEIAKDPQRELNKRRSQMMDTINRLGASVHYVEPDTFIDARELENFQNNRSKPGSIFKVNDIERKPFLEEGADLPVALVQIMQLDQANLQRLMNVVVEQGGANESGSMFLERKKGKVTGNQFLFDNLSFAKQRLGKLLLPLIQRYYPPERMVRILNGQYSKNKFKIGGQDFSEFSQEDIMELLTNANLLEYDVIVAESAFSPSTRLDIARALFELISRGAVIPPELPLKFIDMPADIRAEVTDNLMQQSQQQAQAATDSSNSEITKTLIAGGGYTVTPEKAQELGLVQTENAPLTNAEQAPNNEADIQATEYANNLASSLAG
jgi:hypothetical protein